MFHFGKLKRAIVSAFHTIPLPPLPEDGSSCRKRWIVSFSQGSQQPFAASFSRRCLLCFTNKSIKATDNFNYKHEKYLQIPTISFKKKNILAFPKILNWSSSREIPSHQGSRSMTCSNTTKPCPLVVELNQPTPLKNMLSRQIGWKFPFQGENLKRNWNHHLVLPRFCSRL